jgi:hypothetical protein
MEASRKPQIELAKKTLPPPLYRGLCHIFTQSLSNCVLAGGTALSGFYAGHRRSDDLDLFTKDESSHRSAVLAVKSLPSIGANLEIQNESAQYFDGIAKLDDHIFKITVVLDSNLFRVGTHILLDNKVQIVDLDTLFKMKAATLVSRCSEKDLYDLIWLLQQYPERTIQDLIRLGNEIDGGVNGESILSSVSESILRKDACEFSLNPVKTASQIFDEIQMFRQQLIHDLIAYLENEPAPELRKLVRKLERLRK